MVLPWNSPCSMLDDISSEIYHPASFPQLNKKTKTVKFPNGYVGYGMISVGVKLHLDIAIMLGSKDTIANRSVERCVDLFVDVDDPFANITIYKTCQTTIGSQVEDFFDANTQYEWALVLWPYQSFHIKDMATLLDRDEADFAFMHPLANAKIRDKITEGVMVNTCDTVCKSVMSVGTIPDILKGSYTSFVSMVMIHRETFMAFRNSGADDVSMTGFLIEYLKGKTGTLVDPEQSEFIV